MSNPTPPSAHSVLDQLTLEQLASLKGYPRQRDLLAALRAAGHKVPQPVLSKLLHGDEQYPAARQAVAQVLGVTEEQLLVHVRNAAKATAA